MHLALLQIGSSPLEQGLLSPAKLLFNCKIRGIMPILNRWLVSPNNNEEDYEVLVESQTKKDRNHETPRNYDFISIGFPVVV